MDDANSGRMSRARGHLGLPRGLSARFRKTCSRRGAGTLIVEHVQNTPGERKTYIFKKSIKMAPRRQKDNAKTSSKQLSSEFVTFPASKSPIYVQTSSTERAGGPSHVFHRCSASRGLGPPACSVRLALPLVFHDIWAQRRETSGTSYWVMGTVAV